MAGVYHFLVYVQTAPKIQHFLYTPPQGYVYTNWVFWGSLHIHQEMVYTSHFHFVLGPNLGVVYIYIYIYIYIWCPIIKQVPT